MYTKKHQIGLGIISLITIVVFLLNSCKEAPPDAPEIITKIAGKVTDQQTNQPIEGAQITTNPVTSSVNTGSDGNYTIPDLSAGQYTITAKKEGYNDNITTATVAEGKTVNADIKLTKTSPELEVSPTILDFETSKTNLTFFITNKLKTGTVTWTINSNQQWLTISPTEGTTTTETDPIQVNINRDNVNFGNYTAQITITSDAGTATVNVLMTKANPSAPQLSISPKTIDFGSSLVASQVEIRNTGTGSLNWTASSSNSWVIISNSSGTISAGSSTIVNVSVNKSGLNPNNYNGVILFNSNGGSETLSLSMVVPQGTLTAPTLQITGSPTTNSISVGWTKVTDSQFQSYKIYRSIFPGVTENSTLVTTITASNTNLYTDNNLQSNTKYYYRVFVYSTWGVGSGSNEISANTLKTLGSWVSTINISSIKDYIFPNSMAVLSDDNVWIAAGNEIWHFDGNNWTKSFEKTGYKINAVFFLNPNLGWVVDDGGRVFQYNGIAWTEMFIGALPSSGGDDLIAFSVNDIWISGYGVMYHYLNGQWLTTTLNAYFIKDIDFIDQNNIWVLDYYGKVFKYNGVGWSLVQDLTGDSFEQIKVISNNDIWVASSYSSSQTVSGLWHYDGSSFISNYKLTSPSTYYDSRYALEFISSTEGWSARPAKLSYFNGNDWQEVNSPVNSTVKCIKFLNSKSGWAITSYGDILRYIE